jgi:hypothetical protein
MIPHSHIPEHAGTAAPAPVGMTTSVIIRHHETEGHVRP